MTGLVGSLGYLRIASADPGAWREFGTRVLGLSEGRGPNPAAAYRRIDDFPARLVIVPGDADRLEATGLEFAHAAALDEAPAPSRRPASRSGPPSPELAERRVGRLAARSRPVRQRARALLRGGPGDRPAVSPYGDRLRHWRPGHGACGAPAADDARRWASTPAVLGFRLRDSMRLPGEFFGRRGLGGLAALPRLSPRHHSLAFLPMPPMPASCTSCSRSPRSTT